jgi:stage II sporulation protein D
LLPFFVAALTCSAGVSYRVRLTPNDGNRVVTLTAEEYVAAVLAGESSVFRNDEALKAMAIAARSYAARLRGRHGADGFDFCATTHCQRVDLKSVTPRLTLAAQATAGEILWFEGKPAFSVYTRSCGGVTESGLAVWPDLAAPYLRTRSDPYCTRRGPQQWTWSDAPEQIASALRASGLETPDTLDRIAVINRTSSERAKTLLLNGRSTVLISASSFRFALGRELGWNTLRSDRYQVETYGGRVHFHGTGEGHGVGLCQRGADEMATEAFSYREILAFYYPGTSVGMTAHEFQWTRLGGEGVVVLTTRPAAGRKVLLMAENLRTQWKARLDWPAPGEIAIRVYPDLDSFRNATGEPGWVAARSGGRSIEMQPADALESRGVLRQTLEHELLHVMVETHAAPGLPLWFREGVVEWLTDAGTSAGPSGRPAPTSRRATLPSDLDLRQRENRSRADQAYARSGARVRGLAARYGAEAVLAWVARGLPDEVKNSSESSAATNSR